ncbi:MAG: tetratricopeptide repeat protein, partial [Bacteroidetes bacterium]
MMLIKSFSTILFITVSVVAVFSQPKELQDSGKDTLQAYSFYQEAGRLAKIRQLDSSRYYMNMAANEYEAAGEWDRYFDVVYQVSYLYSQEYNYEVSLSYLDSIWNKFSTYFNPEYKSAIDYYGSYALVNMNLFNYIESLNYFKNLEDILVQNPHATPENHLFTYYYHGVIYYRLGQYDEALKLMLRCLDFGVKNKNTSYEGSVYNLLGIIYRRLGEYDRALNFYEKTLALDSPHKTEVQLTPVYNNLGRVHNYLGNYQTALNYFNLGLSALEDYSTDYYTVESRLVNNKAILLIEQGSYTEATIILTHVLEREKSKFGGLGKNSIETLQQLGMLKFKSKNYSDAEHYYHQTLSMMEESLGANNSLLSDIYVRLGQNYLALKQFNDALDAFQYA